MMVDLQTQYATIQGEIDDAVHKVMRDCDFINGAKVQEFGESLAAFTGSKHAVCCANGTDALQIALMALNLNKGDELIMPAFCYAAAVEVTAFLGLKAVLVDADPATYNIDARKIEAAISNKTRAIIPVHLFGQSCDMLPINNICKKNNLIIIEDNAQSLGAVYSFPDGEKKQTGTMGNIGSLSFFPTKNLACYGDGGAMLCNDDKVAAKLKMIASHGQSKKYQHDIIGCNSRLDTLQAAILSVKLPYLNQYAARRQAAAAYYKKGLEGLENEILMPLEAPFSTHVFHQFTMQILHSRREQLKAFLQKEGIPSMVYYPIPLHKQKAYENLVCASGSLKHSDMLCKTVLSLPMHSELENKQMDFIIEKIHAFFGSKII